MHCAKRDSRDGLCERRDVSKDRVLCHGRIAIRISRRVDFGGCEQVLHLCYEEEEQGMNQRGGPLRRCTSRDFSSNHVQRLSFLDFLGSIAKEYLALSGAQSLSLSSPHILIVTYDTSSISTRIDNSVLRSVTH